MVNITRPAEGITLNAGWPEILLDDNNVPMAFTDENEARAFLENAGLTEDEIDICEFPDAG